MPPFHTEQLRKLFIGGLNLDTTEESLKDYFSRWGETVDVVVMRFPDTRRSRGFGFVTYESVESVDAVLEAKPHILDGKEIEPKRAIAKEETAQSSKAEETGNTLKIFVGGLASATTEEDVRNCFTKFCEEAGHGKVEEVLIMRDRENNDRLRGFCFVMFDDKEIVDKICSVKYFEIRTKTVEVRRAETRMAMMKKEQKDYGYTRRQLEDRRRDTRDSYQGSSRMRGNSTGSGQMSMQGGMSGGGGGGGMPFFGNNGGGSRGGSGGFGGGFNMNPMALAGMMSMFMNQMGNMGNMGGGMGSMGMNARGGGDGMGGQSRGSDSFRGSSAGGGDYKQNNYSNETVNAGNLTTSDGVIGYGSQNSSMYGDQGAGSMGDMSGYANAMSAMFGAAGMNPANFQAALYNAYGGGTSNNQMGSYDQSSSGYGPSRNTSSSTSRGYKPY